MSLWYRRLQFISTAVMLFPSTVLFYFGYLSATRPTHTALEAVVLFILAIALPSLVYFLWAAVIWLKRGQQPGADPSSLAARLGKKPYMAFIPVGVMLALLAALGSLNTGSGKRADKDSTEGFFESMRDSCLSSAASALKRDGVDTASAAAKARMEAYCSCVVLQLQMQYTPTELARFSVRGSDEMTKDKKFFALLEQCRKQPSGR